MDFSEFSYFFPVAPMTLLPSKFPRNKFDQAKALQPVILLLMFLILYVFKYFDKKKFKPRNELI